MRLTGGSKPRTTISAPCGYRRPGGALRLFGRHCRAREADDVEGADEIALNDAGEVRERGRPFASQHALGDADARRIDRAVNRAEGLERGVDRALDVGIARDIG